MHLDPRLKEIFCRTLTETGSVKAACKAIGITRQTAHNWKDTDEQFAREWEKARVMHKEAAKDKLAELALQGIKKTVYHQGKPVGIQVEYNANITIYYFESEWPTAKTLGNLAPMSLNSGHTYDVLTNSARQAEALMNHQLAIEDGTKAPEDAKPVPVSPEQLLNTHRANTRDIPDPTPGIEEKDIGEIK